ncbi:hypothetical protein ABZ470_23795 [Streptosporangium sp. NPDC020072]|uniref:hypothetical protein n=1 Tax=Streptosporangium sp. NPDC020072 TaxID=3154788 RepID=UPI0034281D43
MEEASWEASSSFIEDLYPYAGIISAELARRYSLVDRDDITQEICMYVLDNDAVLEEWREYCSGDYVESRDERHASARMRLICRRAGERYCRRETAARVGYSPSDEAFYSTAVLKLLVEHFFRDGITERDSQGSDLGRQTRGNPATAGTWLVSLMDVERGLSRIPRKYRHRLKLRYQDFGDKSVTELAAMTQNLAIPRGARERIERALGTTEDQIHGRLRIALIKLQRALGGSNPYGPDRPSEESP